MNTLKTPTFVPLVLALLGLLSSYFLYKSFSLDSLEIENVGALFLTLIFVALVIERAVEVFITNSFGEEEAALAAPRRLLERKLQFASEETERELKRVLTGVENAEARRARDVAVAQLRVDAKEARDGIAEWKAQSQAARDALKARKARTAAMATTLLGAAAATAGVRVLEGLTTADLRAEGALAPNQIHVFIFVDVVLTALLLAGGAEGIHNLVKDFLAKRDDLV